jgi:hypothetical protein
LPLSSGFCDDSLFVFLPSGRFSTVPSWDGKNRMNGRPFKFESFDNFYSSVRVVCICNY